MKYYVVADVEATSAKPLNAQLLTGCFLLCDSDLDIVDRYDLKVRPRLWDKEAEEASKIHGITFAEANNFTPFTEAMAELKTWLDSIPPAHFVAHANRTIFGSFSTYDYAVLTANLFDYNFSHFSLYRALPRKLILSTHSLARYLSLNSSLDLKSLTGHLGIALDNHHSAEADTMACYEILKKLLPRIDVNDFLDYENFNIREVENGTDDYNTSSLLQRPGKRPAKKTRKLSSNSPFNL